MRGQNVQLAAIQIQLHARWWNRHHAPHCRAFQAKMRNKTFPLFGNQDFGIGNQQPAIDGRNDVGIGMRCKHVARARWQEIIGNFRQQMLELC